MKKEFKKITLPFNHQQSLTVLMMNHNFRQRGSVMLVAMISMASLLALGGLAVLSVRDGTRSVRFQRSQRIAQYAAESGLQVAMEHLAQNYNPTTQWSAFVTGQQRNGCVRSSHRRQHGASGANGKSVFRRIE